MYDLYELLRGNIYPGRGIVVGCSEDGSKLMVAYFIMGRSENSRNRVFVETADGIRTQAFDPAKMVDPSLIIYHPVRRVGNKLVVTNGDQTDTIRDFLERGQSFVEALQTRCFEPDAPNYTPRISAMASLGGEKLSYDMSILKCADAEGSGCNRFTFSYAAVRGVGHFLHTYVGDGNPIPSFVGEPEPVAIVDDLDTFAQKVWANLNEANKVSLYVSATDWQTGTTELRIMNKYN